LAKDQELNASKISTVGPEQLYKKTSEEDEGTTKQPLIAK
jgi:hypothetical protein